MDKKVFKKRVIDQANRVHLLVVKDLEDQVKIGEDDEHMTSEEHHASQGSNDENFLEVSDRLLEQYKLAKEHQRILDKVIELHEDEVQDIVESGAVVLTNHKNFFISIAIEDFEVDDKTFVGISPKAPIYDVMAGKKKGDKFSFRDIDYVIEELI